MSRLMKKIKKEQDPQEFWSKYFTSLIDPYVAFILIKLKVNPNIVTICMIPTSILCLYFSIFIFDKNLNLLIISLIGIIINIIDCADGIVARQSNKASIYGKYLDRICHYFANPTIFLAYGLYCIQTDKNISGFIFILIAVFDLFDVASKDFLYMINLKKKNFSYSHPKKFNFKIKNINEKIIRIFFLPLTCIPHTVLFLFPLFIYYEWLLSFYAILFLSQLIIKILKRSKNIRKSYNDSK